MLHRAFEICKTPQFLNKEVKFFEFQIFFQKEFSDPIETNQNK